MLVMQPIAICNLHHYNDDEMIRGFRHKGLERWFTLGDARGIKPKQGPRIRRMLDMIDQAVSAAELDIPGMQLHALKGERNGWWAMSVSGNYRITFRFKGEDATEIDLEDYH